MTGQEIYKLLRQACKQHKMPSFYKGDVTKHDKRCLTRKTEPVSIFAWVLRETGSHMIDLRCNPSTAQSYQKAEHIGSDHKHFYIFDGVSLKEYTYPEWVEKSNEICQTLKETNL